MLVDDRGTHLGRADLIFDAGEPDAFVLVVENKLYSGFGDDQLARYQAAITVVRGTGGRGGLIALTRDVPTSGELSTADEEWLGSVRLARFLPRLRSLPVRDAGVAEQWSLLLEVLDEQGDMGMTQLNGDDVRAWSRYYAGRQQLTWLLEQVYAEVLDHTEAALKSAHRRLINEEAPVALWYKGRARRILVQQSLAEMQFGMSVPASYIEQSLKVGVWFQNPGVIRFGVSVAPREAERALKESESSFVRRLRTLTSAGFQQAGVTGEWFSTHDGAELLAADDAPAALLAKVKSDITLIAKSKILEDDLSNPPPRTKRRKKSDPWSR
jgi:hypothetical protein